MRRDKPSRLLSAAAIGLLLVAGAGTLTAQETTKVQGLITERSGPTMILQTADAPKLVVMLTASTKVAQAQGAFRKKDMPMAALIPGLAVQVEGTYNADNQLVAKSVKFKGDDLAQAKSIQAGLQQTQELAKQTEQQAAQNKKDLEHQQAALKAQQDALAAEQKKVAANAAQIEANKQKIAANMAKIEEANKRFGQLGDYNIMDELVIYFDNGKVKVDPKYKPQLVALAQKATTVTAYIIEVKGYASAAGSVQLNQKLSDQRANNVTNILLQDGNVPLTNMLAPAAMGESRQIGTGSKADVEKENRRVVVRVLQNKGMAGT